MQACLAEEVENAGDSSGEAVDELLKVKQDLRHQISG